MSPRLTIAGLLLATAFCGVAFASLRSPSQLWASATFSAALATLVFALAKVILTGGRTRRCWAVSALVGWSYFGAAFGPWVAEAIEPRLITTALLDVLYDKINPPAAGPAGRSPTPPSGPEILVLRERLDLMRRVARSPDDPAVLRLQRQLASAVGEPSSRWAAWAEPDRTLSADRVGQVVIRASESFRRIGHSLATLLLSALGGLYAMRSGAGEAPGA